MSDNPDDHVMTFWEHLEELRSRLIRMILAFVVGAGLAWTYKKHLLIWLTAPFVKAWSAGHHNEGAALHFPAPASLFIAYVRLSAMGGVVFALPIILYQLWAFIAPGLYSREKRFALPFVVSSCGLFVAGGYFGWRVAFPVAFQYLLSFSGPLAPGLDVKPTVMVSDYIDFVTHMLAAFGIAFELPVLAFFLSFAGIITYRDLIRFFRYFVVVAFIVSAILTPPDPMSQLLLAIPLCGLYGLSILVAWIFGRKPTASTPAAK
ncbi:MAG TPA: twin-arginine translocase subunit TatC [Polyangiaceae bacterium]|jgi:sec-independent protein translocase protein TatC